MILLVDIGNTRIKWRCLNAEGKNVSDESLSGAELSIAILESLLGEYDLTAMYISNVGQDNLQEIFKVYAEYKKILFNKIESRKQMSGLTFVYEDVHRLGVDRCLAMIGAYKGEGVVVIDAGSALTADYVDGDGKHLGGYILPGYEMSRNALLGKTEKIGVLADVGNVGLGLDTESCVNNGFALLYKSIVSGLLEVAKSKGIYTCALTGGDAAMLRSLSGDKVTCFENLVLDGLQQYSLYEKRNIEAEI